MDIFSFEGKADMTREIINSSQVSRLLGLSELTVRKLARQGVIPGRKVGRKWLFSRTHLIEWVKAGANDANKC